MEGLELKRLKRVEYEVKWARVGLHSKHHTRLYKLLSPERTYVGKETACLRHDSYIIPYTDFTVLAPFNA